MDLADIQISETPDLSRDGSPGRSPRPITRSVHAGPALILESDRQMSRLLADMVRQAGIEHSVWASDMFQACDMLHHYEPGLILSDRGYDDETRLAWVRRLRDEGRPGVRGAHILMLSYPRGRRDIERARDAGVSEFIIKPVAPVTIANRIASLEARPRPFIQGARYRGPDRRLRPRTELWGGHYKRMRDVEDGLTTALNAARAAAIALAEETVLGGDRLAIRVGRSLRAYARLITEYGPAETEIANMHRHALAQLTRLADQGEDGLREPVVDGLEEIVRRRLGRSGEKRKAA